MNAVQLRLCSRCGRLLPLSEFDVVPTPGGRRGNIRHHRCRPCQAEHEADRLEAGEAAKRRAARLRASAEAERLRQRERHPHLFADAKS